MSGIEMENKDMIPIPGAEKFEVEELIADNPYYAEAGHEESVIDPIVKLLLDSGTQPFKGEDYSATSGPAEVYEPVQTLYLCNDYGIWCISTESGNEYEVNEIYCNVSTATGRRPKDESPIGLCMVAVGRLTISRGVAYVDVG